MRFIGIFAISACLLILNACGDSGNPASNKAANAPPPAPTSAPIPNLNASDLQKGRRPDQNREAPPNNSSAAPPRATEKHGDEPTSTDASEGPTASDGSASNK